MLSLMRVNNLVASPDTVCHYSLDLREDVQSKVDVQVRHCLVQVLLILFKRYFVAELIAAIVLRPLLDGIVGQMDELVERL